MNQSKIYHGGAGGRGTSSGYGHTLVTKLMDETGTILLQGNSGILSTPAGSNEIDFIGAMFMYAQVELVILSDGLIDISNSVGNVNISAAGTLNLNAATSVAINPTSGSVKISTIKTGTTQLLAGAVAGELWHNPTDHIIRIGV